MRSGAPPLVALALAEIVRPPPPTAAPAPSSATRVRTPVAEDAPSNANELESTAVASPPVATKRVERKSFAGSTRLNEAPVATNEMVPLIGEAAAWVIAREAVSASELPALVMADPVLMVMSPVAAPQRPSLVDTEASPTASALFRSVSVRFAGVNATGSGVQFGPLTIVVVPALVMVTSHVAC